MNFGLGYLRLYLRLIKLNGRGATAIEYALIAALIAMVIVGAIVGTGGTLQWGYLLTMQDISDNIASVLN